MSNEEAPKTSLPSWMECQSMVSNRDYLVKCGAIKNGVLVDDFYEDSNSLNLTPVHEFIYEYDDADPFKSGWFRHRLEVALDYKERTAKPKIKLTKTLPSGCGYYYYTPAKYGCPLIVFVDDNLQIEGNIINKEKGGYWAKVAQDQFEFEG